MQANVGHETTAERALRSALRSSGLCFSVDVRPERILRCKADIVFKKVKVCVFVDGCFWHKCPLHFAVPKANATWWAEKIGANVQRDRRQTTLLENLGWKVLRVWEHDTLSDDLQKVSRRIAALLPRSPQPRPASLKRRKTENACLLA